MSTTPEICVCGHKPRLFRKRGGRISVNCFLCGRSTAIHSTIDAAIAAWNAQIDDEKHRLFG